MFLWVLGIIAVGAAIYYYILSKGKDPFSKDSFQSLKRLKGRADPEASLKLTEPKELAEDQPQEPAEDHPAKEKSFAENFPVPGPYKRTCGYLLDFLVVEMIAVMLERRFFWIIFVAYFLLKDSLKGRSIGKWVIGLATRDAEGQPVGVKASVARNLPLIIPVLGPMMEYIFILKNPQRRRWGDKLAKTMVVDLRPSRSDIIYLVFSIVVLTAAWLVWSVVLGFTFGGDPTAPVY